MTKQKYVILPEYVGKVVGATPPTYDRKEGGRFELTETLSQKDLGYLFEVIHYPGVKVEE